VLFRSVIEPYSVPHGAKLHAHDVDLLRVAHVVEHVLEVRRIASFVVPKHKIEVIVRVSLLYQKYLNFV
jgi:hypothetical protein